MRLITDKALNRLIEKRADARSVLLRLEIEQKEIERAGVESKLRLEEDKCRRLVARLREWESKFHALELAASAHDLTVEERAAVPAKPATLVLRKRRSQ